jgi:predicted alpha/beta superfamily hydrolase
MRLLLPALLASLLAAPALAGTTLRFDIDLSAEIAAGRFDPTRDRVGLRGAAAPLSWDHSLPAAPGSAPGHYQLELTLPDDAAGGQPLAYKFRIEHGAGQDISEGWEPGRNHAVLLKGGEVAVTRVFGAPAGDVPLSRTGTIERLGVVASAHVSPREVQVWLPPGYAEHPGQRYPVLYLHDGQNVFDARAAGAEWQVDEAAQQGVASGRLRPFIVVAVSVGADRIADYTPTAATLQGERRGGGAPAYARYLVEELKPAIDARYRTRRGPADTAVGGSSLGGLVSLWLALHRPETFGTALVASPSVWWDNKFLLRDISATAVPTPRPRLWLDIGAQEGDEAVTLAHGLAELLRKKGWSGDTLRFVEDPRGRHDETSWARRVPAMLDFLYGSQVQ